MTKAELIAQLSDVQVLGLTIWAEARSESLEGQIAVGGVISNRRAAGREKAWGLGWKGVCTHPLQFSCWNTGKDKNHLMLIEEATKLLTQPASDKKLRLALHIAEGITLELYPDLSKGATHYYSPKGMVPAGSKPVWSLPPAVLTVVIGNHRFYRAR